MLFIPPSVFVKSFPTHCQLNCFFHGFQPWVVMEVNLLMLTLIDHDDFIRRSSGTSGPLRDTSRTANSTKAMIMWHTKAAEGLCMLHFGSFLAISATHTVKLVQFQNQYLHAVTECSPKNVWHPAKEQEREYSYNTVLLLSHTHTHTHTHTHKC